MIVELKEDTHTYIVDGDIASISVTELLHKHGLAPSYKGMSKSELEKYAERGREVHKDIENAVKIAGYKPTTKQGEQFIEWARENVETAEAEFKLAYNYNGMVLAGTADLIGFLKDGKPFVSDNKYTSTFQREYVSWQVSVLDYMARHISGTLNGQVFKWAGAEKFFCLHFDTSKEGDLDCKELQKIPDEEIERLFQCEYEGKIYTKAMLVINNGELQQQWCDLEKVFAEKEREYKALKKQRDDFREKLCKLFEEQGVYNWESPNGTIKATYVLPYGTMKLDEKLVKEKYPNVYAECVKLSRSKGYIKVTTKREDENEET